MITLLLSEYLGRGIIISIIHIRTVVIIFALVIATFPLVILEVNNGHPRVIGVTDKLQVNVGEYNPVMI